MAIAVSLQEYLASQGIAYDVITHPRGICMSEVARRAGLPGERVVKTVVLEDGDGYVLAAVPASHHLRLRTLRKALDRHLGLAKEDELATLFSDCELGAAPPLGAAYGLDVVIDESLVDQPDLYFEGGDHCSLVHVRGEDFGRLMANAKRGRFSRADRTPWEEMDRPDFM